MVTVHCASVHLYCSHIKWASLHHYRSSNKQLNMVIINKMKKFQRKKVEKIILARKLENWKPRGHLCHQQGDQKLLYRLMITTHKTQMKEKLTNRSTTKITKVFQIENKNLKLKEKPHEVDAVVYCTVHSIRL